jgi:arabinofuranosyltransferase
LNSAEISISKDNINKKYLLVMVIFFVLYCLFLSWSFWFQNVDDAYISFRYGRNLMNGHGLVYNPGEYVEGYTNFLWTVITAPFTKVKSIDISIFALSIGLVFSIINIFILAKITRQFSDLFPEKPAYLILLPVIFFALDDSIAFWAIGGMEFPMYTLFILAAAYYYFKINDGPKNYVFMSIFLMLVTLTRPEGNMIFVITMFHFLLYRKSINKWGKKFLLISLYYGVFALFYYGFKYMYYGQIIPNTFYAKGVTDISMNLLLGFKYLALCIGTRLYIFIFILFVPFKKVYKDFKQSYLILFTFVYILYILFVGGDWMIANRFFVPIIPFLYILSAIGMVYAVRKITMIGSRYKTLKQKIINIGVPILGVLLFAVTLSLLEYKELIINDENYKYEHQWSMFGKWLKMNVSPNTVIAVGPAGKIPYYSELYTIDMWGLNNDYISKTRSKRLQAGHKKFDFEYVLSLNPEFIIGYAGFTDDDIPPRYEKFNAPEEKYQSIDVVFRLKKQYRSTNIDK